MPPSLHQGSPKTSSKLKPQPHPRVISEVNLPKPARQPKTAKHAVKNSPINSVKRFDDVRIKHIQLFITSTGQHLLHV